ncbi:hypothetical protein RC1_3214 [Rhodospirillum centenum SW]|uniref:Uncharacterized protein n=1 Tax=Rhodospirillum centenum (strain ATCC 51521 / SW) TaxID=414684 RepID=B6IWA2_RHOCS|nr:hypothetical protein RC1_3214 [Rhodospirillum centenum SW]
MNPAHLEHRDPLVVRPGTARGRRPPGHRRPSTPVHGPGPLA